MTSTKREASAAAQRRSFYGWRLVVALWAILLINFAFPMYGASVMYTAMVREMGLSASMLGLGFTIFLLMAGLPAPLVAWSINRFGVRSTMVAGNLFIVAGSVLLATVVSNGWAAALAFGVLIGFGVICGGLLGAQTLVVRWFGRHRVRAMAIVFTATGFGGFVAPPILHATLAHFNNWQSGWWLLATLGGIAALISIFFVREFPSDLGQQPDGGAIEAGNEGPADGGQWSFRAALGTRAFWTVVYCGAAFNAGLAFLFTHTIAHLQRSGIPPATAAFVLSLIALGALAGKVILGIIGRRVPLRISWLAGLLAIALGVALAVTPPPAPALFIFPVLCGLGIGISLVCVAALPAELFGRGVFASLVGFAMTLQTAVSALVPFAAGILFDRTGSYMLAQIGISIACVVGAGLLFVMRAPKPDRAG